MEIKQKLASVKRVKETGLVVETSLELRLFDDSDRFVDRTFMKAELDGDPTAEDFIPFDELTNEKVLEWTLNKLGEEAINDKEQEMNQRYQDRLDRQEQEIYSYGLPKQE